MAGSRQVDDALEFAGRPQLAATLAGAGGGRSLLLNGHIDVVTPAPVDRWTSDPWRTEIRDGNLYGRGTCDMKGGIGSMVFAAETLSRLGVRLGGDLVVCTNTDEESSGAGGIACVQHGVRADAGICTEPTGFEVWTCSRGSLTPVVVVEGRPGHAELTQPHWSEGGAVNAIEKMAVVLDAFARLRDEWRTRSANQHPHLSPTTITPTVVQGGEWIVTYPSSCSVTSMLNYLPGNADADGWGTDLEAEFERWIAAAAQADPWLREHPPQVQWTIDIPPFEVPPDHPIIATMLGASAAVGARRRHRRPRLVVRRGDVHALRRHADGRLRPAPHRQRPLDRRVRPGRRPGDVRPGDRGGRDPLVWRQRLSVRRRARAASLLRPSIGV